MCKLADIFVTKIGLFGLLYLTNFRPCKIGKSSIASGIRPRNDIKPFRPNVSLKGTGYALGSLVQPTKLRVLILTFLNKKNTLSGILLKKRRRWDSVTSLAIDVTSLFAFYGKCAIKQTGYALGSLVQPTKLWVLILTSLNKKNTLSGILLKKGGGGIRTHGTLARSTVFKTAPINRSGTPPKQFFFVYYYSMR